VATDDLHAPLGLDKPAADRPIVHSVTAAVLGIAAAALVIGAAAWYAPLSRNQPAPPQAATPAVVKPEAAAAIGPAATPHAVQVPGAAAPPSRPQITSILPAGALEGAASGDQPAAPGSTDRIITIIDGRTGTRQEVRIPATSDAASAPLSDLGSADPMRNVPDTDEVPEPRSQTPRAKPNAPQKRAKPGQTSGQTTSTNSALQPPLR
jgi:hypothetical protein